MAPPSFTSRIDITHIGTATAIITIDGVINLLTDPVFSPAGTEFDIGVAVLKNSKSPALGLAQLPPIDAVLLSHEDHPDNLDAPGRQMLDGRRVLTTMDGATKLAPRPGVRGLRPWEETVLEVAGRKFVVTATPCRHFPGGECIGFVLTAPEFGETDGKPNGLYFSGDTIYIEELAAGLAERFHIVVALLNIGAAAAPREDQTPFLITMDGAQASRLFKDIGAELLVPMHYEGWGHFSQEVSQLVEAFDAEGVKDSVQFLTPGQSKRVV